MKRRHFHVYTEDEDFDVIGYIKQNHLSHPVLLVKEYVKRV